MADRPEARIPCPQCGGAIHPVAGKCKHCKADLAALRVGKPQAQAVLPKLAAPAAPVAPVPPSAVHSAYAGGASGSTYSPSSGAAYTPGASSGSAMRAIDHTSAQFSARGEPESVQILPPRPTGRMFVAVPAPRWPIVVIAISALAILLSIGALAR